MLPTDGFCCSEISMTVLGLKGDRWVAVSLVGGSKTSKQLTCLDSTGLLSKTTRVLPLWK